MYLQITVFQIIATFFININATVSLYTFLPGNGVKNVSQNVTLRAVYNTKILMSNSNISLNHNRE
jgi:hypothetical protein